MTPLKSPASPVKPLAQKRLALPDRPSQGWVADQISDRIGETVGQQAVSYWENGRVELKNVHPRRLKAYAEVLKISLEELAEAAGYTVSELFPDQVPNALRDDIAPAKAHRGPIPPVVNPIELPLNIPAELEAMIAEYGDRHPELHNETTLRALVAPRLFAGHSQGPQTADQWYEYFLMNRRWLPT